MTRTPLIRLLFSAVLLGAALVAEVAALVSVLEQETAMITLLYVVLGVAAVAVGAFLLLSWAVSKVTTEDEL